MVAGLRFLAYQIRENEPDREFVQRLSDAAGRLAGWEPPDGDSGLVNMAEIWFALEAEANAASEKADLISLSDKTTPENRRARELWGRVDEIEQRIFATPARTIQELAAKTRVAEASGVESAKDAPDEELDLRELTLRVIRRDAERLAGTAS